MMLMVLLVLVLRRMAFGTVGMPGRRAVFELLSEELLFVFTLRRGVLLLLLVRVFLMLRRLRRLA